MLIYRWRQMNRFESDFWKQKSKVEVWFEDGRLFASSDGKVLPDPESLMDVAAIDAQEERGRIVRLHVDKKDGTKDIYSGLDDMDAFAAEFKMNVPQAKFRRVRLGFPMKLKEV